MRHIKILILLLIFTGFIVEPTYSFDFSRYKLGDLDEILQQPRPNTSAKVLAPQRLRFRVSLVSYAENCETGFLKAVMIMVGASRDTVDKMKLSKCIKIKSQKGSIATVFIQDQVAEFLPKEIPLGSSIDIFCVFLYISNTGPGILVNEFQQAK